MFMEQWISNNFQNRPSRMAVNAAYYSVAMNSDRFWTTPEAPAVNGSRYHMGSRIGCKVHITQSRGHITQSQGHVTWRNMTLGSRFTSIALQHGRCKRKWRYSARRKRRAKSALRNREVALRNRKVTFTNIALQCDQYTVFRPRFCFLMLKIVRCWPSNNNFDDKLPIT